MEKLDTRLHATDQHATELELKCKKAFYEDIVPIAEKEFREKGGLESVVFVGFGDKDHPDQIKFAPMPAAGFMQTEQSKDFLRVVLKAIAKTMDPVCICVCSEAWSAQDNDAKRMNPDGSYSGLMPSERPDRKEVCMFNFESENLNCLKIDEIQRDGKEYFLVEGEVMEQGLSAGRLHGFLKDIKKINEN